MAPTPYAAASGTTASCATSQTFPVTHAVAVGDMIVICCNNATGGNLTGMADSKGNSYTRIAAAGSACGTYWARCNTALTTSDTFNATNSASGTAESLVAAGCSSIGGTDTLPVNTAGSTATPTAPSSGTMSLPGDLFLSVVVDANAGGAPSAPTVGGSFAMTQLVQAHPSSAQYNTMWWGIAPAVTAVTFSCSITAASWTAGTMTFTVPVLLPQQTHVRHPGNMGQTGLSRVTYPR